MKRPINIEDIRKGDLIRRERDKETGRWRSPAYLGGR